MWKQVLIGCGGAFALATAALADSSAVTSGNLNLRSGPGTGFSIVAVTPRGSTINVHGCVAGTSWCAINSGGLEGWSHSNWLAGSTVPVASGVRAYNAGELALYAYSGGSPANAATYATTTATYASTGPVFGRPIRGALGIGRWGDAYGYGGTGWGMSQYGQYAFGNVNGQDMMTDTRNGASYLRQR